MKITFANKRRYFEIIFSEHTCKRFKITYSFESNETNDMERFKQAVNNLKIFPEKDSISIVEAATIMLSVCYGGAIVVMPYSIKQLGVAVFCLFLLIGVLLILYCSLAVLASCSSLDTENCDKEILRDLYPYLFEQAFGGKSRKIFLAVRNTCNVTIVVSVILLAATILSNFIKVDSISKENEIRIASVLAIFLVAPLMYVGVYKDLTSAAYLVVFTSVFAVTGILIDSLIAHASNAFSVTHNEGYLVSITVDSLFSQYGTFAFGLVGPTLILPNIFVFVKEKESLLKTVVVTHGVMYFLYILCGFPAYFLINGEIMPSITETLSGITNKHEMPSLFWVILAAVQFLLSYHLILVSAYFMNPIYQNFESYLDIPNGKFRTYYSK